MTTAVESETSSGAPEASAVPRKKRRHRAGPTAGREFRRFAAVGLEVRAAGDGSDSITITGEPIMYNTPYTVVDMFGPFEETMAPGVAANVLAASADVRFLFNHDGMPLARTLAGTLTLADGPTALRMTATLDLRQSLANDLAVAIERGDVNQMSCGFVVGLDEWNSDYSERTIYRFEELFDVSAVTYPASPTTSVELALRSMMAAPVESRARVRLVWKAAHEAREGKVLSTENAGLLQQALEALHEADDVDIPSIITSLQTIDQALDEGQAGLSQVLGNANPDDDDETKSGGDSPDMQDGTAGTQPTEAPGIGDGTGSRSARSTAPATRQERRDAERSFNDIERAVNDAIKAQFTDDDDTDPWCDMWLEDCGDSWVVFQSYETNPGVGLWRVSYTIDADSGVATLGDDLTQVTEQTTYVPVEAPAARSRSRRLELEAERLRLRGKRHIALP